MKIIVLCGGLSMERDVSIKSGTMIANALRERGHSVVTVDAFFGYTGEYSDPEDIFGAGINVTPAEISSDVPDLDALRAARSQDNDSRVGDNLLDICRGADIVFLGLHGADGEDGRLQAMFDIAGIRYTGSGYLGSAAAMDKDIAKRLISAAGVRVAEGRIVRSGDPADAPFLPCVVKPRAGGSSVGTSIAHDEAEYAAALELGFKFSDELLVERYIKGREVDVGVLAGRALPPIEIRPKSGFFDYRNKYQDDLTEEICPTDLPEEIQSELKDCALRVFDALGLAVYARMDFIVDPEGRIWCLEANTLPGMTPASLLPKEAAVAGIAYGELCELIVTESLKK